MYTWVVCVCAPSQRRNSKFIQNGELKPVNFMQATKTCIDADHIRLFTNLMLNCNSSVHLMLYLLCMCTCMSLNVLPIFINIQCIVHTQCTCVFLAMS